MKKVLGLCKGRHEMPVSSFIFDGAIEDPTDLKWLAATVSNSLSDTTELDLYVTGLTVALVAVINYCCKYGIELTLYHFDTKSGSYFPQKVETRVDCNLVEEAGYAGYSTRL